MRMLIQKTQSRIRMKSRHPPQKKKRPHLDAGLEEEGGWWLFYLCEGCDLLHYLPREEQQVKDSTAVWTAHWLGQTSAHIHTRNVMSDWTQLFPHYSLLKSEYESPVTRSISAFCWAEEINNRCGVMRFWVQLWDTEHSIFSELLPDVMTLGNGFPRRKKKILL